MFGDLFVGDRLQLRRLDVGAVLEVLWILHAEDDADFGSADAGLALFEPFPAAGIEFSDLHTFAEMVAVKGAVDGEELAQAPAVLGGFVLESFEVVGGDEVIAMGVVEVVAGGGDDVDIVAVFGEFPLLLARSATVSGRIPCVEQGLEFC